MTDWSDAVRNAVVVLVIVVIIGIVFGFLYIGMNANKNAEDQLSTALTGLSEKELQSYDGTIITGSQVVSTLEKFSSSDVPIGISTTLSNKVVYFNRSFTANPAGSDNWYITNTPATLETLTPNATSIPSNKGTPEHPFTVGSVKTAGTILYVNPKGRFSSKVVYNKNSVPVGLIFTQE